ncbi:MAG: hypothetical protein QOF02_3578 [Blastocatellia bacterium]|jgi:hypothetical protein|nr:hypothetical protein [Blastocatellia bacterium]
MKRNHKELDTIIDNVTTRIRSEEPSAEVVNSAAERVWARIAAETNAPTVAAAAVEEIKTVEHIRGCADFQTLIPAYLKGQLSDARRMLLEDHTQECIPCRKALKEARSGRVATRVAQTPAASKPFMQQPVWRWAIAATLIMGFTFVAYTLYQRYAYSYGVAGEVYAANGTVYKVTDTDSRPLAVGEKIERGERVRTAKDASAVVRLTDGSLVEMSERAEVNISENSGGTTVNLARGQVIVEAAKQHSRHLYVATDDALVSVTGTIFSVNSATKGSRVSVLEGEVHVGHQGQDEVLHPGDQTTTSASLERVAIKDEVRWSRNVERYTNLMTQLAALRKDLNTRVQRPGVRYSTRLLDMMPEGTVLYGALPNLSNTIAESHRIMQERIQQNPALREWWQKENGQSKSDSANLNQVIERVREFGKYLGSEIAVGAQLGAKGEPENPLVIGELSDAGGFRPFLEQQLSQLKAQEKNGPSIRIIDDPMTAQPASADTKAPEVLIWIQGDIFAAAPKLEQLQKLAAVLKAPTTNAFMQSPFYARIADTYREGAGLIVAADLEKIVPQMIEQDAKHAGGEQRAEVFRELGLTNLKHFVIEQKEAEGKTLSRAMLTFNETKRGIPSWLAQPGPMGALEYISPDANIVTAFVVKEPAALVDDLFGALEKVQPDLRKQLNDLQTEHGLDVRKDFAAPLGGEFAFTIDGPILPTPSWKMIFEVYDQPKLQQTFEHVVDEVNRAASKEGKGGLQWERADAGGYTFYTLRSVDFGLEVHYTYAGGYLIVAPTGALLSNAIRYHDAGQTLLRSARFKSALPSDGNANFSAIFYHDLASLLEPLADRMAKSKNLTEEQQAALRQLGSDQPPTLAYAYAQGDRIVLAANTEGGPFGISPASLLGMPNAFQLQNVIGDVMKPEKAADKQDK